MPTSFRGNCFTVKEGWPSGLPRARPACCRAFQWRGQIRAQRHFVWIGFSPLGLRPAGCVDSYGRGRPRRCCNQIWRGVLSARCFSLARWGDALFAVVDHHGKLVSPQPVGSADDKVAHGFVQALAFAGPGGRLSSGARCLVHRAPACAGRGPSAQPGRGSPGRQVPGIGSPWRWRASPRAALACAMSARVCRHRVGIALRDQLVERALAIHCADFGRRWGRQRAGHERRRATERMVWSAPAMQRRRIHIFDANQPDALGARASSQLARRPPVNLRAMGLVGRAQSDRCRDEVASKHQAVVHVEQGARVVGLSRLFCHHVQSTSCCRARGVAAKRRDGRTSGWVIDLFVNQSACGQVVFHHRFGRKPQPMPRSRASSLAAMVGTVSTSWPGRIPTVVGS